MLKSLTRLLTKKKENHFKLLGVMLNPELSHLEVNWEKTLRSARKEAHKWAGIRTSHFGRVNIAKTCLLSKFTHLAVVIPPPVKKLLKEIEKFFETFINRGKRCIFPKKLIFSPKETGGLGLPNLTDFFNSMGMTWFRRMGTSKSFWLTMFNEQIKAKPYAIPSLSECTLDRDTVHKEELFPDKPSGKMENNE